MAARCFYCFWIVLFAFFSELNAIEKVHYSFTTDPIDVVIPCVAKDTQTLDLCIEGIRKYGRGVRRIIVVSKEKLTDQAEWYDETLFPFQKKDIAIALFRDCEEIALRYIASPNMLGWIYQQFLKLYAVQVIPEISPNVLVLDADTVFLKPTSFMNSYGEPYFTVASEYHPPYFFHMNTVFPWLNRVISYSGIAHHMLFQKCVIDDFFQLIEEKYEIPAWKALCHCIDLDYAYRPCLSEYEMYVNFIFLRSSQPHLRELQWANIHSIGLIESYRAEGFNYVSCHSWMR